MIKTGSILCQRYLVKAVLGQGRSAQVLGCADLLTGSEVALKVPRPGAANAAAIEAEFELLSSLAHPTIVAAFALLPDPALGPCLSLEWVRGAPLQVAAGGMDLARAFAVAAQLLDALVPLHDRGLAHGDLSADNVFEVAPGRIKLLDLGLAHAGQRADISGTPRYLSPEVLQGQAADHRADLFALGVLLRELLTGCPVFSGADLAAALEARVDHAVPPLGPERGVPAELGGWLARLMAADPDQRPESAWQALQELEAARPLALQGAWPAPTPRPPAICLAPNPELIAAALRWFEAGETAALVIDAGLEPARPLAEALALALQRAGGPAHVSPAGAPLCWARTLVPAEALLPGAEMASTAPLAFRALSEGAPLAGDAGDLADAVAQLLAAQLGSLGVLVADGGEDRASVEAIARLLCDVEPGPRVIVVLGAVASEPSRQLLERVQGVRPAAVEAAAASAWSAGQLAAVLAKSFGEETAALSPALVRATSGEPTLLRALLRQLVGAGAVSRVGGGWQVHPAEVEACLAADAPGEQGLMQALLRGLPAAGLALLEWLSLDDGGQELDLVVAVGGLGAEALELVPRLEARGLLAGGPGCASVQPAPLASYVRARLSDETRRDRSRRLGEAVLESRGAQGAVSLLLAGRSPRAVPAVFRVAEMLTRRLAFAEASALYERALPLTQESTAGAVGAVEARVRREWAACAAHLGEHARAAELLKPLALGVVPAPGGSGRARAAIDNLLRFGGALSRSGQWAEAAEALRLALEQLGVEESDQRLIATHDLALVELYLGAPERGLALLLDGLRGPGHGGVPDEDEPVGQALVEGLSGPLEPVQLKVLHALGAILGQLGRHAEAAQLLRAALRRLDALTDAGPARQIAAGAQPEAEANLWLLLANTEDDLGHAGVAIALLAHVIGFYEQTGRVQAAGRCYNNLAIIEVQRGRWAEAIALWERFRRIADRGADHGDAAVVLANLGNAYLQWGRFEQAEVRLAEALRRAELVRFVRLKGQVLGNQGELAFCRGEIAAAEDLYDRALDISRRLGARDDEVEVLRRRAELLVYLERWSEAQEVCALGQQLAAQVGSTVEGARLRCLGGLVSVMFLDDSAGLDGLRRGVEQLNEHGARLEWARCCCLLSRALAHVDKLEEADEVLSGAEAAFRALGARWDLDMAKALSAQLDRTDHPGGGSRRSLRILLDVNRSLASTLDLEELLSRLISKALEVTSAERGFVILFDAEGRATFRAGQHIGQDEVDGPAAVVSSTVVQRVLQSRAPFAVTNVEDDASLREQTSVLALGLRSIMAAPLIRSDRVLGIIYVDSPHVIRRFRHRELELLTALAEAAAVAVENAQLYDDLKRKTDMMYYMAHEFRNPLTAVLSFSDMLLAGGDDLNEEQAEFLGIIRDQGRRLARMVSSVLELAKLEAGSVEWTPEAVDLSEVVRSTLKGLSATANERAVQLRTSVSATTGVFGNRDRLVQVLTNLVGNSLKFVPEGGWVEVQVEMLDDASRSSDRDAGPESWIRRSLVPGRALSTTRRVRVRVRDNGPGLEPEAVDRVFERFTQSGSRQSREKGTGLGLAICKEIVEHHGGRIWAEAHAAGGMFCFSLPVLVDSPGR